MMPKRQKKMQASQNETMVCSLRKNSIFWKPMLMEPLGMAGSCAAALLAPLPMAMKTRATKTSSMAASTRIRKPMKAGRSAGVVRTTVPGTLPVWTSSPATRSPVLLVRVVRVDELDVDEAGDHDEQHAGQPDEADPVLLQRDAELDMLGLGRGADDVALGVRDAELRPVDLVAGAALVGAVAVDVVDEQAEP